MIIATAFLGQLGLSTVALPAPHCLTLKTVVGIAGSLPAWSEAPSQWLGLLSKHFSNPHGVVASGAYQAIPLICHESAAPFFLPLHLTHWHKTSAPPPSLFAALWGNGGFRAIWAKRCIGITGNIGKDAATFW